MKNLLVIFTGVVICLIIMTNTVYAQWIYIPPVPSVPPHPLVAPVSLETKSIKISGEIHEQAGEISYEEILYNPNPFQLEGIFYFPLLSGSSIKDFAFWVNGEKISGEILEADKARKIYEDIVRKMRDPAILEYMNDNIFRCRIFPIPGRGDIRIEIKLTQVLRYESGNIHLQLPLKQAVLSQNRLPNIVIDLLVKSSRPTGNFYSPSFAIAVDQTKNHDYRITYEGSGININQDFSLYYRFIEDEVGVSVIGYYPHRSDGYFMVLVSPSWDISPHAVSAKEILYIVDCSGSMRKNNKIEQVKAALSFGLNGLNRDDRFNIIAFSSEPRPWKDSLVGVNKDLIKEAEEYIGTLEARGGTNIDDALKTGLKMFSDKNNPKILVFLTDGQPTVGITDPKDIFKNITQLKKNDIRIFSFGVGYDVNTFLLDKLSELQHGSTTYVEPEENLEVKLSGFFEKIEFPVLTDISVDFGSLRISENYPVQVPDLFKGSQLTIVGRYKEPGNSFITVKGQMQGKEKTFRYSVELPEHETENNFLPHIWATRKIGFLLDEIRLHGESEELVEEVIRLAKQFGIPTPYTSYLITEDQIHPVAQQFAPSLLRSSAMDTATGAHSEEAKKSMVQDAKIIQKLKTLGNTSGIQDITRDKGSSQSDSDKLQIRRIGDKAFYYQNDTWIDTRFNDKNPVIKIKFLGKAYFELLDMFPDLSKYLSLGDKIKISLKTVGLEIGDNGQEELSGEDKNKIKEAITL